MRMVPRVPNGEKNGEFFDFAVLRGWADSIPHEFFQHPRSWIAIDLLLSSLPDSVSRQSLALPPNALSRCTSSTYRKTMHPSSFPNASKRKVSACCAKLSSTICWTRYCGTNLTIPTVSSNILSKWNIMARLNGPSLHLFTWDQNRILDYVFQLPEKDIDTVEIEEEDWIDYTRRSTADAVDKMGHARIRCWNKTHRKMKWKSALRIATSPSERWKKKAAVWNPELSSRYRTNWAIGRPRKRWEDDINDFLKQNLEEKENEEPLGRKSQNNNTWINIAKDRKEWTRLEEKYKEMCKMTEKKYATWSLTRQQQHSDQEQCDDESSSSAAVKSKVNVDRKRSRSKWRVLNRRKYPDMKAYVKMSGFTPYWILAFLGLPYFLDVFTP